MEYDVRHDILDTLPGVVRNRLILPSKVPYKSCVDMVVILDFYTDPNKWHMLAVVQIVPCFFISYLNVNF